MKQTFGRIVFLIFLSLHHNLVFAQREQFDVYDKVEEVKQELIDDKVDTLMIYTSGCVGCEVLYEEGKEPKCNCVSEGVSAKIFWTKKGGNFMKNVNCCEIRVDQITRLPNVFGFYIQNKERLLLKNVSLGKGKYLPPEGIHNSFQKVFIKQSGWEHTFEVLDEHKEGEYAKEWQKYKWKQAEIEWIKLIEKELQQVYSKE